MRGYRDLVNAAQNCSFGRTESGWIAEQARTPIAAHGQGLNFEGQLTHVHIFANFAGVLSFKGGMFQTAQPFFIRPTMRWRTGPGRSSNSSEAAEKKQPPGKVFPSP